MATVQSSNSLEKMLQIHLSDLFLVYMKVYKFHWNLKGPTFISVHKFYNKIFDDLSEIIDQTAERMRQIKMYAPCSAFEFSEFSKIKEVSGFVLNEDQTLDEVIADLQVLQNNLSDLYKVCDEATVSLLTNHDLILSKHQWFADSMVS